MSTNKLLLYLLIIGVLLIVFQRSGPLLVDLGEIKFYSDAGTVIITLVASILSFQRVEEEGQVARSLFVMLPRIFEMSQGFQKLYFSPKSLLCEVTLRMANQTKYPNYYFTYKLISYSF